MENYKNPVEIPVGFGIALEHYNAMDYFLSLSPATQQQIIGQAHAVQSKDEMYTFVQSVVGNNFQ